MLKTFQGVSTLQVELCNKPFLFVQDWVISWDGRFTVLKLDSSFQIVAVGQPRYKVKVYSANNFLYLVEDGDEYSYLAIA